MLKVRHILISILSLDLSLIPMCKTQKSKGIDKGKGRSFEKVINQNGPKNCLQLKKLKINIYVHMWYKTLMVNEEKLL